MLFCLAFYKLLSKLNLLCYAIIGPVFVKAHRYTVNLHDLIRSLANSRSMFCSQDSGRESDKAWNIRAFGVSLVYGSDKSSASVGSKAKKRKAMDLHCCQIKFN